MDYKGENDEKLKDDDVKILCLALLKNDKFSGPLDLSNNDLTDLVILTFIFTWLVIPLLSWCPKQAKWKEYHRVELIQEQIAI